MGLGAGSERIWGEPAPRALLFVHGAGGSWRDAEGFSARAARAGWRTVSCDLPEGLLPWECVPRVRDLAARMRRRWPVLGVRATSIGAWFALVALRETGLELALLQAPVIDMAGLIGGMMRGARISREELAERGEIRLQDGNVLSWRYLVYAEENAVTSWQVPTSAIVGERDEVAPRESVSGFCQRWGARLTMVDGGAHWLHTPRELRRLAQWEEHALAGA